MPPSIIIIIIGGGLAGLSLAQGLKNANIPFHVFEKDSHSAFRAQGYRIRVSPDGAAALRKILSDDLWSKFEKSCVEVVKGGQQCDAISGEIKVGMGPGPHGNGKAYNADRAVLRSLLLSGLEDHISFSKSFLKAEFTPSGVFAHFGDGSSGEGTMIIGADGSRSRLRKQYLPNHHHYDTEGRAIYGKTILTDEVISRMPQQLLRGISLVQGKTSESPRTLFLDDYVYWVLVCTKDTIGMPDKEYLRLSEKEAVQLSLSLTNEWDARLKAILQMQQTSSTSTLRITTANPEIASWIADERITFLGDSIHGMPPTGGIGANTAFRDAAKLVEIIKDGVTKESIAKYEEDMRDNARTAMLGSFNGAKRMFDMKPMEQLEVVEI